MCVFGLTVPCLLLLIVWYTQETNFGILAGHSIVGAAQELLTSVFIPSIRHLSLTAWGAMTDGISASSQRNGDALSEQQPERHR